jgi:hypothetical protein
LTNPDREEHLMPVTLPTTGWVCVRVEDAWATGSSARVHCRFCDRRLRWVHVLSHPHHAGSVSAGRCWAARLCDGYDAADAERRFRSCAARRARFVDLRGWTRSRSNPANVWRTVKFPGGVRLRVVLFVNCNGRHGVTLIELGAVEAKLTLPLLYDDRKGAAVAAFDAVEGLKTDAVWECYGERYSAERGRQRYPRSERFFDTLIGMDSGVTRSVTGS